MNKTIARLMAAAVLAGSIVGITAGSASANPPRTNNCYSEYRDGVTNPSWYRSAGSTISTCRYHKYTTYFYCACTKYVGVISVPKKSVYV